MPTSTAGPSGPSNAPRAAAPAGAGLVVVGGGMVGAVLLSLLWWRTEADRCLCEYCPDGYCTYADLLRQVLRRWDAPALDELRRFTATYLHAHNPLAPLFQAPLALLTPHPLVAYMVLSAAASVFATFAVHRIVAAAWPAPSRLPALLAVAFGFHVLVVRSFARPITDALGMAATIGALWALQRYLADATPARAAALALGQVVGLFTRVSFIPMVGMPVLAALLRPGSLVERTRRAIRSGVLFGLVPMALFVAATNATGTLHLTQVWEFAHRSEFVGQYSLRDFLAGFAIAGQGYAVLLVAGLHPGVWQHPTFRLHLAWVALYLAFLALGGGALWPRYFLPVVPSLFVLAAPILLGLEQRRPRNVRALLAVFVAGNVLYVVPVTVSHDLGPAARLLVRDIAALADPGAGPVLSVLERTTLRISVSEEAHRARLVVDGDLETSWATARSQRPGNHVEVDLGEPRVLGGLSLWSTLSEYPHAYAVDVSLDGATWRRVAASRGALGYRGFLEPMPRLFIPLPGVEARFVRIATTAPRPPRWGIHELSVYVQPRRRAARTLSRPPAGGGDMVLRAGALVCPRCGGPWRIVGAVVEPHAVRRLLAAGLAAPPPGAAGPRRLVVP